MPSWVPAVISGLTLAAITGMCAWLRGFAREMRSEWCAMRTSQRQQLKMSIVRAYEEAAAQGYVKATVLETILRQFEAYQDLDGNSYVATIVEHAKALPIRGELPPHE